MVKVNIKYGVSNSNEGEVREVMVEMSEDMFTDGVKGIEKTERLITEKLKATLGISPKVTLVNPKSIARSEGKAKRVIDKRKLK